jgi:nucleoside-diphosphate-sugar epimerase
LIDSITALWFDAGRRKRRLLMRVLISGGTGFIGHRLTIAALNKGWDVHLLTREPELRQVRKLGELGANITKADLTEAARVEEVFSEIKPSHYFHNAGWYELGIPASQHKEMWSINVQGVSNALDAAGRQSVQKIVVTSSTTALGDTSGRVVDESFKREARPNSWYEETMQAAHNIVLARVEAGMPIVMGSPAQVVGPGDHSVFGIMLRLFLRRLLPPTLWAPEGTFSFVHVDDVAHGLVRIMEDGQIGENYFMAGSLMNNREMISFWKQRTGRSFPVMWIPRRMAMLVGYLTAPLLRLTGQPAFISPEVVRSSYASFRYSDAKIRDDLGLSIRSAERAWAETIVSIKG